MVHSTPSFEWYRFTTQMHTGKDWINFGFELGKSEQDLNSHCGQVTIKHYYFSVCVVFGFPSFHSFDSRRASILVHKYRNSLLFLILRDRKSCRMSDCIVSITDHNPESVRKKNRRCTLLKLNLQVRCSQIFFTLLLLLPLLFSSLRSDLFGAVVHLKNKKIDIFAEICIAFHSVHWCE